MPLLASIITATSIFPATTITLEPGVGTTLALAPLATTPSKLSARSLAL